MKKIYLILLFSVIFMSCKDELIYYEENLFSEEFKLSASTDTIEVFPWSLFQFEITVESGEFSINDYPVIQDTTIGSFEIIGPWFKDVGRKKLFFQISGKEEPAAAKTVNLTVQIGKRKAQVPVTVKVSEFYLADRFETNLPNDTIVIPKGGNCLLKITCIDSSGRITPKSRIERLGFSLGYSPGIGFDKKYTTTSSNRDSISYYIMFSAFPDIVPSEEDKDLQFSFYLSNKRLILPMKITY